MWIWSLPYGRQKFLMQFAEPINWDLLNVDMELTLWKAKIFDAIRRADQLGSAELEKVLPNIQDLKMVITELEDRIHQLRTECPLEWKPVRDEIDGVKGNLTNTYDEVIDYIGGRAAPVDVPG
jgi:hypothetical protein